MKAKIVYHLSENNHSNIFVYGQKQLIPKVKIDFERLVINDFGTHSIQNMQRSMERSIEGELTTAFRRLGTSFRRMGDGIANFRTNTPCDYCRETGKAYRLPENEYNAVWSDTIPLTQYRAPEVIDCPECSGTGYR